MKKATKKKLKKIFNLYNFAILACIVVIIASIIILVKPDFSSIFKRENKEIAKMEQQEDSSAKEEQNQNGEVEVIKSNNAGKEISEKDARKLAKKQFKKLDEKVKEDDLEVLTIKRSGEEFYYISSRKNTVEIDKKTGKITRINAVKVDE